MEDLFNNSSNADKLAKVYEKYFYLPEDESKNHGIHSEWLLSKNKLSLAADYSNCSKRKVSDHSGEYITEDERNLFKNLGSNMIATGKIVLIESEERKKVYIEIRLEKILSICYEGPNLIGESENNNIGLNLTQIKAYHSFYENLYAYNITGFIRRHDIYDNRIPHLNDDMDMVIKEGTTVTCLIIRNKLTENKYVDSKLQRDEFLQLSLKNSIIKDAKQFYISQSEQDVKIPFLLGMNYTNENNKWIDKTKDLMLNDTSLMNESITRNLINNLDIKEYSSLDVGVNNIYSYKVNAKSGFSYEKIRKVQNYDWADDYYKKGVDMMSIHNYEKAVDYFRDAEKLDSLNKDIYTQKGVCFIKLDQLDKAKKEFKNCLKVEPNDEMAKKYLLFISKKDQDNEYNQMLGKKRTQENK